MRPYPAPIVALALLTGLSGACRSQIGEEDRRALAGAQPGDEGSDGGVDAGPTGDAPAGDAPAGDGAPQESTYTTADGKVQVSLPPSLARQGLRVMLQLDDASASEHADLGAFLVDPLKVTVTQADGSPVASLSEPVTVTIRLAGVDYDRARLAVFVSDGVHGELLTGAGLSFAADGSTVSFSIRRPVVHVVLAELLRPDDPSRVPGAFAIGAPAELVNIAAPLVSWSDAPRAARYDLVIGTNSDCSAHAQSHPGLTSTSTTLAPLADGTYYVCVTAKGQSGVGTRATNTGRKLIVDTTPPAAFAVTSSASTTNPTPTVTWSAATGAHSYSLIISTASDCSAPLQSFDGLTTTSKTLSPLVKGTYYICVEARDEAGNVRRATNAGSALAFDRPPVWNATLAATPLLSTTVLSLQAQASDPDLADTVSYALVDAGTTCQALTWAPALAIDAVTGQITGTPAATTDVETCDVRVAAASGGVTIAQTVTLTIYPPPPAGWQCSGGGDLLTTCTVNDTQTLADGDLLAGPGNLVVASGGRVQTAAKERATIRMGGDVTVQTGGRIAANLTRLEATNVAVQSGASIDADALGHQGVAGQGGEGPAPGAFDSQNPSGGSHGGVGGRGAAFTNPSFALYGSPVAPTDFGSAGGGSDYFGTAAGGAGGGAIKIVARDLLTIAGTVSAVGGTPSHGIYKGIAGGAGGSVWIVAARLAGNGLVSAAGGNGVQSNGQAAGGGGGGRIAIEADHAFAGTIAYGGGAGAQGPDGEAGTYHLAVADFCDSGSLSGTCVVTTVRSFMANRSITGTGSIVVTATGRILAGPKVELQIAMTGDVVVEAGGRIEANLWPLSARSVTVQSGAAISANALGSRGVAFADGEGAGGGAFGSWGGRGGGHGGHGGGGGGSGPAHGDAADPSTYGSAGGGSPSERGGDGGGRIRIVTTDALTIDGLVSANGRDGYFAHYRAGGAGAGGSVRLVAGGTLGGMGRIEADGGAGQLANGNSTGGGGGGRISLTFEANELTQTPSRAGGVDGNGGTTAADGSLSSLDP